MKLKIYLLVIGLILWSLSFAQTPPPPAAAPAPDTTRVHMLNHIDDEELGSFLKSERNDYNGKAGIHRIKGMDTANLNYELVYDFHKKQFVQDVRRIKYGYGLNFKVINFPRYRYDAMLEYDIVTLQTQNQQNDFRSLFGIGDKADGTSEGKETPVNASEKKDTGKVGYTELLRFYSQKLSTNQKDKKIKITLDSVASKTYQVSDSSRAVMFRNVLPQIALNDNDRNAYIQVANNIINAPSDMEGDDQVDINDLKGNFYAAVDSIDLLSTRYVSFTDKLEELEKSNKKYLTIKLLAETKKDSSALDFENDLVMFSQRVINLKGQYYKLKDLLASSMIDKDVRHSIESGLDKNYYRIRGTDYNKAIKSARGLYNEVVNIENYTVNFGKIMAYGDEVEIKFGNIPKSNISGNIEKDFSFPKIIGVYNYWTFDVSTGLVAMSTINEKTFNRLDFDSVTPAGNKSFTRISQRNKAFNLNIGFTGFIQFAYVFSPTVRWGIAVGGGVSASSELNGAFFFGSNLGLRIGRKMLVSFEGGLTLSKSSIIKEKYKDGFGPVHGGTSTAVFEKDFVEETYTENRVKPGIYFGVAFNLITVKLDKSNRGN